MHACLVGMDPVAQEFLGILGLLGILRNLFGPRNTVCAGTPGVGSSQGPPDAPPSLHLVQGTSLTQPHHSQVLPITLNHHNGTDSSYIGRSHKSF